MNDALNGHAYARTYAAQGKKRENFCAKWTTSDAKCFYLSRGEKIRAAENIGALSMDMPGDNGERMHWA